MICFNCGNVLTNSDYCSHCGMDVSIYKKVVRLSNAYYNAGLVKAQNRDLSGAMETLHRCIKINKRQIDARNLLGLVYFEMGETVQAFREWVVSLNIQPDNNAADKYLKAIQADKNRMNELNQTVRKFNVALTYAQQGTDDMAIIQLKKVLNQNNNLVKGHQLLAVLFMKHGEFEKAKKAVVKSLKIDRCNPLSISYLREINKFLDDEKKNSPEERARKRKANRVDNSDRPYLSGNDVIIPRNNFRGDMTGAQTIMHILAGLLLGAALVYFVITPARISHSSGEIRDVQSEFDQKIAIKNSSITELQREVEELETELEQAQTQLSEYVGDGTSVTTNMNNLMNAAVNYLSGDAEKSIEYIEKIDTTLTMNSNAYTKLSETLSSVLADELAETYFQNGYDAAYAGNDDEAITWYTKCIEVDSNYDEAYYRLGHLYSEKGDSAKAKEMFQTIVDKFPDSEYYDRAVAQIG